MRFRLLLPCLGSLALAGACGSDDPEVEAPLDAGPSADAGVRTIDLVGSWQATSHVFTNNADSAQTYDVLGTGGETRMTVLTGGGTRTFRTINGASDDHDSMLAIVGDILRSTTNESPPRIWNWSFNLTGDTLTLDDAGQNFDFTLAGGTEVDATEHIVFVLNN